MSAPQSLIKIKKESNNRDRSEWRDQEVSDLLDIYEDPVQDKQEGTYCNWHFLRKLHDLSVAQMMMLLEASESHFRFISTYNSVYTATSPKTLTLL